MKKQFALILLCGCLQTLAQQHNGFIYSDYAGVISARLNPAVIANSPFKYDVNLANGNFYITNNIGYLSESSDGSRGIRRFNDNQQRFLQGNASIGGFSAMLSLKNRATVAFQYQLRAVASGIDISPDFVEQFGCLRTVEFAGSSVVGGSGDVAATSWHEFSLTYAGLLIDNGYLRLKGGATVKMANPIGSAVARVESFSYSSDDQGLVEVTEMLGQIGYSANLNAYEQFDGSAPLTFPAGTGFKPAADIGLVYETVLFRDDPQTNLNTSYYADIRYEHRLGVSITDIGRLRFDYGSASFDVLGVLPQNAPIDFDTLLSGIGSVRQLRDSLATLANVADLEGSYTVSMPTALNVNYDYNMRNGWFLNASAQLDMSAVMNADYRIRYPNSITLTPRYDTGLYGAYFPLYINFEGDAELGLGLRYGPLTVGTHSVGSLISAEPSSMGVFFSLSIHQLKSNAKKPYCFGRSGLGTAGTRRLRTPLYKRKKFLFF